ncbi:thioredoxin family protein [Alienimonas chondri]|uniref:Thioredoxin family protein n=1 Tax=Alienimonas chondri TaxID=2681879 RepID=A0ABX1VBC3_9PLAN|nr:thioredoxin family protein [Alienimonas chondri]NNJ25349.1 hypothetical protein [Alienimonas chondri]
MIPFAPAALLLVTFAPPAAADATPEAVGVVRVRAAPVSITRTVKPVEPVWQPDLAAAFALSAKTDKPVLVLVGAEWCHYCHKQDDETLTDPAVKKALAEGFIPVRLDADDDERVVEILQVGMLPQVVILSPKADLLGRAKGYHTPAKFRSALLAATAKHAAANAARLAAAPETSTTL